MKGCLLVLVILGYVCGSHGGCQKDNWWLTFDASESGLSKCQNGRQYINGFYRNHRRNPDGLHLFEEALCCDPSSPYRNDQTQVVYADWWGSFDRNNHWNQCPAGYFLQGLYKSKGDRLSNIEEGRCVKPATHPYYQGHCYDENILLPFDNKGTSKCLNEYYISGLYRGGCDQLACIEMLRCCKMAPRPDTLDSKDRIKTMVMDKTMYRLAQLANYMGYGWCGGCRAAHVGEDFRRNRDTWEADTSGRCNGYKSNSRLSMNYGDWKFAVMDISYGEPFITSLQPESIDSGVVTNNSPTPTERTMSRLEESTRRVTHTTTSSWEKSHDLAIEISYTPPDETGGVGGKISYMFGYESSSSTTDSTENTQKRVFSVSDSKEMQPYSSTNVSLIIYKTRTTVAYTATVIAQFSAELQGFLRWGWGRDNPDTNYHYQHRGSGKRPTVNYRFGSGSSPFNEALKQQSDMGHRPWLWSDMKANHPGAQGVINSLVSEGQYGFKLTGKFDDVIGKKIDVVWTQIPFQGNRRRKRFL